MKSKKGQVLHLSVFLLLGALILFISLSVRDGGAGGIKGESQADFIINNVFEAEAELLKLDVAAKGVSSKVSKNLALSGGFVDESECGRVGDFNLWNKRDKFCYPDVDVINNLIRSGLDDGGFGDFDFKLDGEIFKGKGGKGIILSESNVYRFNKVFFIFMGYSFEEYELLKGDASLLINNCKLESDLASCLNQRKDYWKFGSCDEEKFNDDNRVVKFCVLSPNLYEFEEERVKYNFALDFSGDVVAQLVLDGNKAVFDNLGYSKYKLHVTNWQGVLGSVGSSSYVFSFMPQTLGFYHNVVDVDVDLADTSNEKIESVIGGLNSNDLVALTYVDDDGLESMISYFVASS
jgi:hypothetical protein